MRVIAIVKVASPSRKVRASDDNYTTRCKSVVYFRNNLRRVAGRTHVLEYMKHETTAKTIAQTIGQWGHVSMKHLMSGVPELFGNAFTTLNSQVVQTRGQRNIGNVSVPGSNFHHASWRVAGMRQAVFKNLGRLPFLDGNANANSPTIRIIIIDWQIDPQNSSPMRRFIPNSSRALIAGP